MEQQLLGSLLVRSLSFAFALIFLPLPFATGAIRVLLALTLFVSCIGQLPNDLHLMLSLESMSDFQLLLPNGGDIAYNVAVGIFFALLISTAVAAAFLSARWLQHILQTRFSANSLLHTTELPNASLAISLILAASVFIGDFFFQVFRTFHQSFEAFPLSQGSLSADMFSNIVIQAGADIFFVAFLSSSFLFFAVFVVAVSLLAGVKYLGQTAISIADGGLTFVFLILVLSASVYASSALLEKAQNEAMAKLSSLQVTQ